MKPSAIDKWAVLAPWGAGVVALTAFALWLIGPQTMTRLIPRIPGPTARAAALKARSPIRPRGQTLHVRRETRQPPRFMPQFGGQSGWHLSRPPASPDLAARRTARVVVHRIGEGYAGAGGGARPVY